MSAKKFILTTFLTLVFFNLARAIGSRIFAQTEFWRSMLNDQWHHYQLGILLLFIIPLILRKKKVVRDFILAIGSGMIIDESMYIFYPFNQDFSHYSIIGIVFEFLLFAIFSLLILKLKKGVGSQGDALRG